MSEAKDRAKRKLDNLQSNLDQANEDLRLLKERVGRTRDKEVRKRIQGQVTISQAHVNRLTTKVNDARKKWEQTS